jgi:uncharacterized protein (UPF0335 family)
MSATVNSYSVAQDQLASFVRRIENLEEEIKSLNGDKSAVYKEAGGNGFDVKVLRKVIADRRKDYSERLEFETIYDLYAAALGMLPEGEPSHVHARGDQESTAALKEVPNVEADTFPTRHTHPEVVSQNIGGRDAVVAGTQALPVDTTPHSTAPASEQALDDARSGSGVHASRGDAQGQGVRGADGALNSEIAGGENLFVTEDAAPLGDESAALIPEPDATPAGAVVAITSGVTGGESAATPIPNPSQGDATETAGAIASSAPILTFPAARSLRPNCINPNNCAGHGKNECWSCEQAANGDGRAA